MGWLHCTPDKGDCSRAQSLCDEDPLLVLPEIESCDYILEIWQKAGIVKSTGMGVVPLDWQDVKAFSSFYELNAFEASAIVEMSRAYSQGNNTKERNSKPPYQREYSLAELIAREKSSELQEARHNAKEAAKLR